MEILPRVPEHVGEGCAPVRRDTRLLGEGHEVVAVAGLDVPDVAPREAQPSLVIQDWHGASVLIQQWQSLFSTAWLLVSVVTSILANSGLGGKGKINILN